MKKIGVVICNYNKAEMLVECIKCILENTFKDLDIYVVDNGSTDNSAAAVKDIYKDVPNLFLIENHENLGGTGGFNTGLKAAFKKSYDYLMCVDNDAFLDEKAIENLYIFLEAHTECGIAASKIYHMEEPGKIQQYGQTIDFNSFSTFVPDLNVWDNESLPEYKYVDAVAACSLMVRRETIEKIGFWSEDFFLYWDDTDWCTRCLRAGMKVATVGNSYALHQMGAKKEAVNTFPTYYAWRNWILFFIKYTDPSDYERMCRTFLNSIFAVVYAGFHKGEKNLTKTVMLAYNDAIHNVTGKARDGRIFELDKNYEAFEKLFSDYKRFYIEDNEFPTLAKTIKNIASDLGKNYKKISSDIENTVVFEPVPGPGIKTIKLCDSIFEIDDMSLDYVYIDLDLCVFSNEDQAMNVINYSFSRSAFIEAELPVFMELIKESRNLN